MTCCAVRTRGHAIEFVSAPRSRARLSATHRAHRRMARAGGYPLRSRTRKRLEVSPFYDSLLGKAIAHAATRADAASQLATALTHDRAWRTHQRAFLARVLRHPAFLGDNVSTALIDEHFGPASTRSNEPTDAHWALAAFIQRTYRCAADTMACGVARLVEAAACRSRRFACARVNGSAWTRRGLRVLDANRAGRTRSAYRGQRRLSQEVDAPRVRWHRVALFFAREGERIWVQLDGVDVEFEDLRLQPTRRADHAASAGASPRDAGRVVDVAVKVGQRVDRGASLATLEARKGTCTGSARCGPGTCVHVERVTRSPPGAGDRTRPRRATAVH